MSTANTKTGSWTYLRKGPRGTINPRPRRRSPPAVKDNGDIRAVIFDLGRVLIDFDYTTAARRICRQSRISPEEISSFLFDSGLKRAFEAGKIPPRVFFREIKKKLGLEIGYSRFLPLWNEVFFFSLKNRQVYRIVKRLKGRYRTALLSNTNVLHFEYIKKKFPLLDAFDRVFVSFRMGSVKPQRQIYRRVLRALHVSPAAAFYTDDRAELVESARSLGMRAFVFKGAGQLKRDLAGCGIRI